jgi:serine/threonine protein kinase
LTQNPPIGGTPEIELLDEVIQIAGDFDQLKYEGHGACGNVYLGIDRPIGAMVAVKHMRVEDEKTLQHCRGEIEAHQPFAHPACLGYVVSMEVGNHMLPVTSLMECGDMQWGLNLEWSGTPYMDWATIKTICVFGIGFGMEYIHSKGFIHRDLK